jgi:DNA repair protein RecN (Recombination protein N)
MLTTLSIKNLALVEDLHWDLQPGLIAVTGETGAGKSIIVGALKLLLGERADRSLIRANTEVCAVEASLLLPAQSPVHQLLADAGIEACHEGQLILKRSIAVNGANKQFINCSPVTSQLLKQVGSYLIDLHGPHDHQSLVHQDRQLQLLDHYAKNQSEIIIYKSIYQSWLSTQQELQQLLDSERDNSQQIDLLKFQIQEIRSAGLQPHSDQTLNQRHRLLANSTRIQELITSACELLADDDINLLGLMRELGKKLQELEKLNPELKSLFTGYPSALLELNELEQSLRYQEIDTDEQALNDIENQLSQLQHLKRKYGHNAEEILQYLAKAEQKLFQTENRTDEILRLEQELACQQEKLQQAASKLTHSRQIQARLLAKSISDHLVDLGFKNSLFECRLIPQNEPQRYGLEMADFYFSPNPGEPFQSLRNTASSGEMSRVMLAVKSALAKQDQTPLMVFDEIDANVGGNIAEAVGIKMQELAQNHQVIVITHFPQVAAKAHHQFCVEKKVEGTRTTSCLTQLNQDQRIEEMARMLGGNSTSALQHARSLLQEAHAAPKLKSQRKAC